MKQSEKTKEKILQATIDLVGNKGYAATSTREIAEKAGVSEATIFKYYKSKDLLLEKVVTNALSEFYQYSINEAFPEILADKEEKTTKELLKELITERLLFFKENNKAIQVIFQEMMINKSVRDMFNQKVWSKAKLISNEIFKKGKNENQIRDIDPFYLRKAIFGMIFYTVTFEQILDTNKREDYNHEEEAEKILDIVFNGIGRDDQ